MGWSTNGHILNRCLFEDYAVLSLVLKAIRKLIPGVTWNPPTISLALPSLDLGRPAADGVARVSKTESPEDCGVPK